MAQIKSTVENCHTNAASGVRGRQAARRAQRPAVSSNRATSRKERRNDVAAAQAALGFHHVSLCRSACKGVSLVGVRVQECSPQRCEHDTFAGLEAILAERAIHLL